MVEVSLADLEGEIFTVESSDPGTALMFRCPLCRGHYHLVYFNPGSSTHGRNSTNRNVWANPSGSTVDDLTLSPSYRENHSRKEGTCELHIFVNDGKIQILGDSRFNPGE